MQKEIIKYYEQFSEPEYFWLLLFVPFMIIWYIIANKKQKPAMLYSSIDIFATTKPTLKVYLRHFPFILRLLAILLIIIALARPQSSNSWKSLNTEGIDIVMSLDISASMLAKDFKPNRLEAAKEVAKTFIAARPNDRLGLVIFSGESFTQCPLTTDHAVINNMFESIKTGMVEDGTAIGMGLATGVSRLKNSNAKSKVLILLTDGVNNAGTIAPLTAAEIANNFGIRVYTIGVGSTGQALSPVGIDPFGNYRFDYVDVKIDESTLKEIASKTNGKYFRATDNKSLENVYKEIDKLEKTIFEELSYTQKSEEFLPYLLSGLALLLLEFLLKNIYLRTVA